MDEEKKYTSYEMRITIDEEGNIVKATQANGEPLNYLDDDKLRLDDGQTKFTNPVSRCFWVHLPTCQVRCIPY